MVDGAQEPVVLVIIGAVPHKEHILGGRLEPAGVGMGEKVFYGLRGNHPVAELVKDLLHIHHLDPKSLSLSKGDQVSEPRVGGAVDIPAEIPVGDQDVVGPICRISEIGGNIFGYGNRALQSTG